MACHNVACPTKEFYRRYKVIGKTMVQQLLHQVPCLTLLFPHWVGFSVAQMRDPNAPKASNAQMGMGFGFPLDVLNLMNNMGLR